MLKYCYKNVIAILRDKPLHNNEISGNVLNMQQHFNKFIVML